MATQTVVAKQLGLSDRWLRKLVSDGLVKDAGRGSWNTVSVAKQLLKYRDGEIKRLKAELASARAQVQRHETTEDGINKGVEEARKARAQADMAEMKTAEMRGELIPAVEIAGVLHDAVQIMKTRMLAIPGKCAPKIGAREPAHAQQVLREEVDEALEDLAKIDVKTAVAA